MCADTRPRRLPGREGAPLQEPTALVQHDRTQPDARRHHREARSRFLQARGRLHRQATTARLLVRHSTQSVHGNAHDERERLGRVSATRYSQDMMLHFSLHTASAICFSSHGHRHFCATQQSPSAQCHFLVQFVRIP